MAHICAAATEYFLARNTISTSRRVSRAWHGYWYISVNFPVGAEVIECAGADETLTLLESRQFELLIVSLYPLEREGYTVLEQIKERFVTALPPVIMVGDAMLRAECRTQLWQGTAWLDHPLRVSDLLSLIDGNFSRQPVEWTKRPE